ncbi:uncharacterized protein PITG_06471 [Phytophthora infestans T30-4]|uniref:ZSWIM1/3 RNaseH-like domain-containing protein n=1 Tax=Phytophthora infestans (strain T30-4) TaxID=403677 RepID=D0N4X6_PHYIT|nr:uncharacterized protein PITG_06471 [Phytophthora infestans T30-4]EEY69934.1 conserved hypothetical protein [Phytophthora infestans T30-4]|eukprot:XP_002998581.1 conserved hypothetical protein [Phytophthora infestans T30-4]
MGEGVLLTNGDRWKYHRRVLTNLFSARALREHMAPVIQRNVQVLTEALYRVSDANELVDFYKLMHKFTFETFTEIGFGRKLGSLASPDTHPFEVAFDEAHRISGHRFTAPVWLWKLKRVLNVGTERRLRDAMAVIDKFLMGTIVGAMERHQHGDRSAKRDIVSIILDTMETSGQRITPGDIRDIVFAGMIAGRDTTADALSWLMHTLHNNPRVARKLRKEILAALPQFAESESYVPSIFHFTSVKLMEVSGKPLMLKDVSSMIAGMRRNSYTSPEDNVRVTEVLQDFSEEPGIVVNVFRDADTKLTSCITFQTAHMRRMARQFPDVMCVDATHGTNISSGAFAQYALIDGEPQENMKSSITALKRNNGK